MPMSVPHLLFSNHAYIDVVFGEVSQKMLFSEAAQALYSDKQYNTDFYEWLHV
jgi:hypothetical protein